MCSAAGVYVMCIILLLCTDGESPTRRGTTTIILLLPVTHTNTHIHSVFIII